MQDSVKVSSFGFVEFGFRTGWTEIIATNEIKSVKPRVEGGTNIRLTSDRVLLVSCPIQDVSKAMRDADGRMYATS